MSEDTRWIRLCVDTLDHPVIGVRRRAYTHTEAWLWLIMHAAWRTHKTKLNGKTIELQPGQLPAGRAFLAKTWRWTEKKVRVFLDELVSEGMLEKGQSKGHFANVVTICNYDKYQLAHKREDQNEGQSTASQGPVKGQTFTRDTNTPVDNNIPQQPEPSRAQAADGAPRKLFDEVHEKLTKAANGSLCPLAVGLNSVSEPLGWINSGADLDLDVVPAVAALAEKAQHGSIGSWRYFEKAVTKNRDARLRKLPAPITPKTETKPKAEVRMRPMTAEEIELYRNAGIF